MRVNFLALIAILGITVNASSSPAASASTTASAAASAAASGKAIIVTDKTVTFTMPLIADPSGKVPKGSIPAASVAAASASGTKKGAQITNDNGGQPTPTSRTQSNAAAPIQRLGAVGSVGALLLPLLL